MKNIIYFLLFGCLFLSCKKDNFEAIASAELSPFIDDFIAEGAKREVTLSKERLEALLVAELTGDREDNVCGLGWSNFDNQRTQRIEILNNEFCWEDRSAIERENLVFHELGHALLSRGHVNNTFANGTAESIMCSGTDGFCSNFRVYYENETLKGYYLDELFGLNPPTPEFSQRTNFVRTTFEDQFEAGLIDWEEFITGDPNLFVFSIDSTGNNGTTGPNSMLIEVKQSVIDEGSFVIVKRFELTDFQDCSSLVLKADIKTEGELDGVLNMGLSLRERLPDGSLNRFYIDGQAIEEFNTPTDTFKDFELEMYCVSERTNVVSVSFSIRSKLPIKIFVDNLRVELVE